MRAHEVVARAVAGERRWLARAITLIELRHPEVAVALAGAAVRRRVGPGRPHVIGVTGPPGAGKSTFVDALVAAGRSGGGRVAVVAVDPSSPFSGGAILGDRIRMERHVEDDEVFIRSLSSRGHLGGLSASTAEVVDLLDAAAYDLIIVETVGVGQSELGVVEVADTAVVVLTPESGDTVQTMKAGLLEIADIFVVNKDDRPGGAALARSLEQAVSLDGDPDWVVPVVRTCATEGRGIAEVLDHCRRHVAFQCGEGEARWRKRRGDAAVRLTLDLVAAAARAAAAQRLASDSELESRLRGLHADPHLVAEELAP